MRKECNQCGKFFNAKNERFKYCSECAKQRHRAVMNRYQHRRKQVPAAEPVSNQPLLPWD